MAFSSCAHKALNFPSRVSPWDQLLPPVEETAAQLAFTTWSSVNVVSTWQSKILKITPRTPLQRWPTSMALWIPATSQAESWPPSEQPALEGWRENSVRLSWGAAQPTPSSGPSPSSGQCLARGELIVIRRELCTTAPATAEIQPLEHRNQTARLLAFSDSFVLSDPLGGRFVWVLTGHPEAAGSPHRKWELATATMAYMVSWERNYVRGLWRMWGCSEGNLTHPHPERKAWGPGPWIWAAILYLPWGNLGLSLAAIFP